MDTNENQALVQLHTELGNIIRAYRQISIFNYAYAHNRPLCEAMHRAAEAINALSLPNIHIDTKRIWSPQVVSFKGTALIKKWQMASLMEELIQKRGSIAQSLTQKDVTFIADPMQPDWWERQLVRKGGAGRTMFLIVFFGMILLLNLGVFAYIFLLQ